MNRVKFPKKIQSFVLFLTMISFPFLAFGGPRSDHPIQLQLMGGFPLGAGGSIGYNLGDHLFIGVNSLSLSMESDGEKTENNERVNTEFSTTELVFRLHPIANFAFFNGLFIQAAAVNRDWKIKVSGEDPNFSDTGQPAAYEMTVDWPKKGMSYAIGFNWVAGFGFSGGFQMGVITGDDPKLSGKVNNPNISQADVDEEVAAMEERENFGDTYSTLPEIAAFIGFNF